MLIDHDAHPVYLHCIDGLHVTGCSELGLLRVSGFARVRARSSCFAFDYEQASFWVIRAKVVAKSVLAFGLGHEGGCCGYRATACLGILILTRVPRPARDVGSPI